jgi:hypothetical protein
MDWLIKRAQTIRLPDDVVELIELWPRDRSLYVSSADNVFNIKKIISFTDDTLIHSWNKCWPRQIINLKEDLWRESPCGFGSLAWKVIMRRLRFPSSQGLTLLPILIKLGDSIITYKNTIGIQGVVFDSKLQWSHHILKANKALNTIICRNISTQVNY